MRHYVSILFLVLMPATAVGQTRFEVTPFVGLRAGGSFRALDQDLALDVQSSLGVGVLFDYVLSETMQLELSWSRQSSDLEVIDVSPVPGEDPVEPGQTSPVFPIEIDYFHGAFVYGGGPTVFRPYVLLGAGVARLNPDVESAPVSNEFSFTVGAGFRSFFSEHFGVRMDARAFGVRAGDPPEDVACGPFGCVSFEMGATFWQGQVVAGLILAF